MPVLRVDAGRGAGGQRDAVGAEGEAARGVHEELELRLHDRNAAAEGEVQPDGAALVHGPVRVLVGVDVFEPGGAFAFRGGGEVDARARSGAGDDEPRSVVGRVGAEAAQRERRDAVLHGRHRAVGQHNGP